MRKAASHVPGDFQLKFVVSDEPPSLFVKLQSDKARAIATNPRISFIFSTHLQEEIDKASRFYAKSRRESRKTGVRGWGLGSEKSRKSFTGPRHPTPDQCFSRAGRDML